MDSNNWRKREPRTDNPSEESDRKRRTPPYKGGRNPTRGGHSTAHLPGRSHRAATLPDPEVGQAIDEGRRLYVGNLPSQAKVDDIRSLFADISDFVKDITMSIDPMTGRNPSYCFVDFTTREAAADAIEEFNGQTFMGRPLKDKPGLRPRGNRNDREDSRTLALDQSESPYAFNRCRRIDAQVDMESLNSSAVEEGRRLYVGGLPKFSYQAKTNQAIRDLFHGFDVEIVSKLIYPHTSV